jgi:hypothetical protein
VHQISGNAIDELHTELLCGMRSLKKLLGYLSEIVNEAYDRIALEWVVDLVDVHRALVEQVMKHVGRVDSGLSLLLVAEYQVDPLVQVCRHVIGLESGAVGSDKLARVVLGPGWQDNVVQSYAALLSTQIELVRIHEKVWQVEKLGY